MSAICPRCGTDQIAILQVSPVPGAWEVRQCETCFYTWRTTEPARRSERAHYPQTFRLTAEDLAGFREMPVVPPLNSD